LQREVRANLVYREFTRIGGGKVPDDKTMERLARQLGPEPVEQLHRRRVAIVPEKKIIAGRKLRVDTTVVETNIHYPTDSSLLGDGARVLTRLMKRVSEVTGAAGTKLRDRTRSVKLRVEIARASRSKSEQGRERRRACIRNCWRGPWPWWGRPSALSKTLRQERNVPPMSCNKPRWRE
jgi:IS5 family transposase